MDGTDMDLGPVMPVDLAGQMAAPAAARAAAQPAVQKIARDFESIFLQRLMEEMRRTVPESGLLESGTSDQIQGLFWMYLAQDVADKGGLGLAKELERQLKPLVEKSSPPAAEAQP